MKFIVGQVSARNHLCGRSPCFEHDQQARELAERGACSGYRHEFFRESVSRIRGQELDPRKRLPQTLSQRKIVA
jgi:hypothetical protein